MNLRYFTKKKKEAEKIAMPKFKLKSEKNKLC